MSDSGFPQLPPGSRPPDLVVAIPKSAQTVKIESVRGALRDLRQTVRVQGEITHVGRNGSVTLRTEQGDEIDLKLRSRIMVQQGQKLEIELPPGTPPRQAILRPLPQTVPATPPQTLPPPPAATLPPAVAAAHPSPLIPPEIRTLLDAPIPAPATTTAPPPSSVSPSLAPPHPEAVYPLIPLSAFPPAAALLPPAPLQATTAMTPALRPAAPASIAVTGLAFTPQQISSPAFPNLYDLPAVTALPRPNEPLLTMLPTGPTLHHHPLWQPDFALLQAPLLFPAAKTLPSRFVVRIVATTPPDPTNLGTPQKQHIPSTSSPATLHARVIGITPQHHPVLSVALPGLAGGDGAPYLLQFPTGTLPVGTQVELLPQTMVSPATPATFPDAALPLHTALFSGWLWPAFDDAFDILNTASATQLGSAATQSLAKILPSPANPAQMGAAILFFVAAIRSGDIGGWMGERTLNSLKRDGLRGSNALEKIARDVTGLSRLASEPLSQDWRGLPIPYVWQNEIHKMHLYYRHQGGDEKDTPEDKKDRSTRFIFDLHLDRIGDLQLDGLMKDPRLDLILRTRTPFARSMQTVMRQKYLDILESGKLQGDLAFQTRTDQWVRVETRLSSLKTTA